MLVFALATVAFNLIVPITFIVEGDQPLVFAKGQELFKFTLGELPAFERTVIFAVLFIPALIWVYGVLQIVRLALSYRTGEVFAARNSGYFIVLGIVLVVIGICDALAYPIVNIFMYERGISPWLGDIRLLQTLEPDMIMAGLFFVILGKIMRRGAELQEFDRLTI